MSQNGALGSLCPELFDQVTRGLSRNELATLGGVNKVYSQALRSQVPLIVTQADAEERLKDSEQDKTNERVRGMILDSNVPRSRYNQLKRKMPKLDHFYRGSVKSDAMAVLSANTIVVYRPSESAISDSCPLLLPTDFSLRRNSQTCQLLDRTDHVSFSYVGTTNDGALKKQGNLDLADQASRILYFHKRQQKKSVGTALIRFRGASDVVCYKRITGVGVTAAPETADSLAFESTAPNPLLSAISHRVGGRGGRSSLLSDLKSVKGQVSIDIEADQSPYGIDFQCPDYQGLDLRVKSVAPNTDEQSIVAGFKCLSAGSDVQFTTDKPEFVNFCDTLTAGCQDRAAECRLGSDPPSSHPPLSPL